MPEKALTTSGEHALPLPERGMKTFVKQKKRVTPCAF